MIVIDVETTGLNPYANGIISIGAVNFDDPTQSFYGEGRPSQKAVIEEEALGVNGFTQETLAALPDPIVVVVSNFLQWCSQQQTSMMLGGYNTLFDYRFLEQEILRAGIRVKLNPFNHHIIDLHTAAHSDFIFRQGRMYPKDMSAYHIYTLLGLPDEPKPHNAMNGAVWEAEALSRVWFRQPLFSDFAQYPVKENPWA